MKEISCNISNFEELIKGNYLYVDKTDLIFDIVKRKFEVYLLYRPNNFGKSLTLSTIKAIFEGRKELFKGLSIYQKDYDWKKYPVIYFELKDYNFRTLENIDSSFEEILRKEALVNNITLTTDSINSMFRELIEKLYQKRGDVVILIDDYDKPFIDNNFSTNNLEIQRHLFNFYGIIKAKSDCIRMALLTGVCHFYLADMLSGGLNNIDDISNMSDYATLYGYTKEELDVYFKDRIKQLALMQNVTLDKIKDEITSWYGNYCFEKKSSVVFNPLSLAKFFNNNGKFEIYKSNDHITKVLQEIIKDQKFDINESYQIDSYINFPMEINQISALDLMVQTGLFTIKGVEKMFNRNFLKVDFSNIETIEYWKLLLKSIQEDDKVFIE